MWGEDKYPPGFKPDKDTTTQKLPSGFVPDDGEPVKKKVGGVASKIGQSASDSALKDGLSTSAKKTIDGVEIYNKQFREATGLPEFTLGSELPQIKKAREEKEYTEFRGIEENEIKPVLASVATGTIEPQQLKELYKKPYGKKIVTDTVNRELPSAADVGGLDEDIVGNERKWEGIATAIQEKNRAQGVEAQNQSEFQLDNELANTFNNYSYGDEHIAVRGGGEAVKEVNKNTFGVINTTNPQELQDAKEKILKAAKLWDADGNIANKEDLLKKIDSRIFQLKAMDDIHPNILQYSDKIASAVAAVPVQWKKDLGSNQELVAKDGQYVMAGLNYIRDLQPGKFAMIMGTIDNTGKIAETDYQELVELGREVNKFKDFKEGRQIVSDNRSFLTNQVKKANLAGALSQRVREMGASKNRFKVKDEDILEAYQSLPDEIKDDELLYEIRRQEAVGAGGKGITKTGGVYNFFRGIARPLKGIANTVDYSIASPFEAYLESKRLDRGDQLIPDGKGGYTDRLKEGWLNKATEGFGSFLTQVMLARGVGMGTTGAFNAIVGRIAPRATLALSNAAALNIGTPVSVVAQSYGDEYIDFLEKTGNPTKAALGAFVSTMAQGAIERFVMPDIKIADKIGLLKESRNFGKEIINVIENGGGKADISKLAKDFVSNTTKILSKEAVAEETLQNGANLLTESIISPDTAKDRDLLEESKDISLQAITEMAIPAMLGGAGDSKVQRQLSKAQLHHIGVNKEMYQESLDRQFTRGLMTKPQYELSTEILNLHGNNVTNAPKRDANGELISAERQLEYAYQSTVSDINSQQAAKQSDNIQREPFEKKIEEADKIKRQIFYGEENKSLPPKESEPIIIDRERDLNTEGAVDPSGAIQNAIESGKLTGANRMSAQAALGMPEGGKLFMQEVADQALNKQGEAATDAENMRRAREVYGDELVKLAVKMFPKEQTEQSPTTEQRPSTEAQEPVSSGISVIMPEENRPPEVVEPKQADGGEPPMAEPPITTQTEEGETGKKKGILNRLYEAKNVPEAAKEGFRKEGLKYQTSSQEEAQGVAKAVIDEVGIDDAVLAAEAMKFDGDVNSLIFAESLNRLAEQEQNAITEEDKLEAAQKFAEVAITYDKMARVGGRFNAAINYFYKKSPLGIVLKENADRKAEFDQWGKPKDKSWKEFFDEMMKDPEFAEVVKAEYKKQRATERKARIDKVRAVFKKAKEQFKSGATYATIIPPQIITGAIDLMEKAYEAGEAVVKIVQDAIDYINTEMGDAPWDKEKFRKEWEGKLAEGKQLTNEELKERVLNKFRNKLKGLSDKQKEELVSRAHRKLLDSGALDYEDFRNLIAQVTGRGELTPEETARMKDLIVKANAVDDAAKKWRDEKTDKAEVEYRTAQVQSARAARELNDMFQNKPDIVRRLVSMIQLNTLGVAALVANVTYNFWNQTMVRLPVGIVNNIIDRITNAFNKNYEMEFATIEAQKEFWKQLGVGSKEAINQIRTGLSRQDYLSKEVESKIRPFQSIRDLVKYHKGKKQLTRLQYLDKLLQAMPQGMSAEMVARLLNVGDKPQRFAAEGAQASAFAKTLGLKGIDYKLFIEFPREEAYIAYKAKGLSDEEAGQKADYVKDAIIKEGQRSTFQQDNLLNDAITRAAGVLGGKDSGVAGLAKTLVISPYIKIPTNAFWSLYNMVNPEVAMLQAITHTAISQKAKTKGDLTKSKLQNREARYWLAHAIVGVGLRAVVIALVKAGMFTPAPDDDESKKERDAYSLYDKPGSFTIGGITISNRWLGIFGAMGNVIAKRDRDMTPEQREAQGDFFDSLLGGMEIETLKEMENGVFANSSGLLQSLNTGDFSRYGMNTLNLFANILQPATSAQFDRARLSEVPSSKGDNFLDKLNQNFAQRSALYRKLFDVQIRYKRDIWGQPIPKGGNVLSRMFGISKSDPQIFGRPIYNDFIRTNDSGFLPPAVLPTLNGQKLNSKQEIRLQEYIGNERKRLAEPYVNNEAEIEGFNTKYKDIKNDEDKKNVLQYLYTLGRERGLEKFYMDYPQLKPKEQSKDYLKEAQFDIFKTLKKWQKP